MEKCIHILPMNKLNGAENMVLNICKNIKEYEPIAICGGDILESYFKEANIESYSYSFSKNNIFMTLININNIIKKNQVKIIHCHDNMASIYGYILKNISKENLKVISHIHSCYPWLETGGKSKVVDKLFRNKYDYNLACGKIVYDFYKRNASYLNYSKVGILSNTISISKKSYKAEEVDIIRKKFNIPKDKIVLGFAGRVIKLKGLEEFIYEFKENKDKFLDCIVLIVGSGDLEEHLRSLVKELKIDEYFIFTGYQKNMDVFYEVMDIFFLTSLYEGLPMVILEAMSHKKAVVSMDVGGISEVVKNGENGYLIEPKNYKEFLNKINELKRDENKRRILGQNGYELIKSKFNIEKYVDKLCDIYNKVLREEL